MFTDIVNKDGDESDTENLKFVNAILSEENIPDFHGYDYQQIRSLCVEETKELPLKQKTGARRLPLINKKPSEAFTILLMMIEAEQQTVSKDQTYKVFTVDHHYTEYNVVQSRKMERIHSMTHGMHLLISFFGS